MDRQWFHWAACPTFRSEVAQAVGAEPEVAAEVESAEWVAALEPVAVVGLEQAPV
jgi:hypothetical protein